MNHTLFAEDALLPDGWARNVRLHWNDAGQLIRVETNTSPDAATEASSGTGEAGDTHRATGPVIPGMPNLHSHAFQRAFAGLTEYQGTTGDSFWSWRERMYRFANRISPEQLEAIATWLYIEMLEAGYTSVCEFHYVHHDAGGQPYADDTLLAQCLLRAARTAGIGLTLLPVLYQTSGFGATPPTDGQRRFIRSTDNMLLLLERLLPLCRAQGARLGLAPHSLRAVPPDSLRAALNGLNQLDPTAPVHIHIAEQPAEVEACLAWSGQRPVEWLLDHAGVDSRWCLVHATHLSPSERRRAAQSAAVAGICPSTEANLGDGIFDMPGWLENGGVWGIGSDSHATVNAAEELMLLEYGQRLHSGARNVLANAQHPQVATALTLQAVSGGARASGQAVTGLMPGARADFVELDADHPALAGLPAADMLSAHVFASHRSSAIASVWVGGRQQVQAGRHALHQPSAHHFVSARRALIQEN